MACFFLFFFGRYHYYLQLKNDIVDGRLPCSVEQAVRLAAFSLQGQFPCLVVHMYPYQLVCGNLFEGFSTSLWVYR